MTLAQATAFGIIIGTIGLFVWGRLAYDLVALLALFSGIVTGIVPAANAFEGFADDIVIIIAAALVISAAIARSGVVETAMRPLLPHLKTEQKQVLVLTAAVASLSVFSKNVGALAIFIPVALQLARRTGTSPSALLMPMAFASLLGGIVTLIGTSPNIIIARVRAEITGQPFGMFDFTPVGLSIAVLGLGFLSVGYRLLPRSRRAAVSMDAAFNLEDYTAEARCRIIHRWLAGQSRIWSSSVTGKRRSLLLSESGSGGMSRLPPRFCRRATYCSSKGNRRGWNALLRGRTFSSPAGTRAGTLR
jgi:di/tricarboxylate transporter